MMVPALLSSVTPSLAGREHFDIFLFFVQKNRLGRYSLEMEGISFFTKTVQSGGVSLVFSRKFDDAIAMRSINSDIAEYTAFILEKHKTPNKGGSASPASVQVALSCAEYNSCNASREGNYIPIKSFESGVCC